MTIRIEALTSFPSGDGWAEEWESLLERSQIEEVFCTYAWSQACAEFDCDRQPLILAGYDQGRLVGLAPLARRQVSRGPFTSWRLEFLALPWADYCDVIAEPERREEFFKGCLEYLETNHTQWDEIRLANLPGDSPTAKLFKGLAGVRGLHASLRCTHAGPVLDLTEAEPAALDRLLEKKGVVRKAKALARRGQVEFKVLRTEVEVRPLLQDFYSLHTARYLICAQPSSLDPEQDSSLCRLFDHLTAKLSPLGRVCVPVLFLDGQPIALFFGFEYRGSLTLYATTFDIGLLGTSPGEILALEVARYCRAVGIERLDFGVGEEAYKFRFTNTLRRNCELTIHRNALAASASATYAWAKAKAKGCPPLAHLARAGQRLWRVAKMEAQRVGVRRAVGSFLVEGGRWLARATNDRPRSESDLALDDRREVSLPAGIELVELQARDLVAAVMKYRHALPAWHFKRALEYLRRGHRCFLALDGEHLVQIIWSCQPGRSGEGQTSMGSQPEFMVCELWLAERRTIDGRVLDYRLGTHQTLGKSH